MKLKLLRCATQLVTAAGYLRLWLLRYLHRFDADPAA